MARKLGLDTTAGSEDDDAVGEWLNEGVTEILLETHCKISLAESVALTANEGDYELDSDILAIHKLIDSANVPLERVAEADIFEYRRGSATTSSATMRYAVDGLNLLMVWPTPSSASTLSVYFVPRPTPMSADSHDPSSATYGGIPSEFHKGIEFYALWQGADYDDDASSGIGDKYQAQYREYIVKINQAKFVRGARGIPPLQLGSRRPRKHSPSEDVYFG